MLANQGWLTAGPSQNLSQHTKPRRGQLSGKRGDSYPEQVRSCPSCVGVSFSFPSGDARHRTTEHLVRGPRKARERESWRKLWVHGPPLQSLLLPASVKDNRGHYFPSSALIRATLLEALPQLGLIPGTFYRWHHATGNGLFRRERFSPWRIQAPGKPRQGRTVPLQTGRRGGILGTCGERGW